MSCPEIILHTPRSQWCDGEVFGLGDPLNQARILDKPLSQWRDPDARMHKGEPLLGPALLIGADLWVSPGMKKAFLRKAQQHGGQQALRLTRPKDGPAATADPLQRLPRRNNEILFDLWYLPDGCTITWPHKDSWPEALETAPGLDVKTRTHTMSTNIDRGVTGGTDAEDGSASIDITLANLVAAPVGHWAELARTNLLAIGTQALAKHPVLAVFGLIWAAIRALSLNPFKVLAKTTRKGKGCWIHPSAVVEGCVLGDHVKVDAGAVLRGCILGDHVKVGATAVSEYSIIGHHTELQRMSFTGLSVVYPNARLGGILQLAVAGEGVRMKMGSYGTDMNLQGAVKVMTPEGLRPVDVGYLGVCLGHRAFVASGVWIAPGRAIEAERTLLRAPESIVLK